MIADPAPRPSVMPGVDLGLIAAAWRRTALDNESRLLDGASNYEQVRAAYAGIGSK